MEIVLVKAAGPADRDRAYLEVDGVTRRGRIPASQWLTPGHRRAKTITNCVANRWGDGPDTPRGVRDRVARAGDASLADLPARIDDATIAMVIRGVKHLEQRWMAVPPGGTLRLSWPLPRDFFAGAVP